MRLSDQVELVEVDLATWVVAVLFTPCIAWVRMLIMLCTLSI